MSLTPEGDPKSLPTKHRRSFARRRSELSQEQHDFAAALGQALASKWALESRIHQSGEQTPTGFPQGGSEL